MCSDQDPAQSKLNKFKNSKYTYGISAGKEFIGNAEETGSIPELGRSPGEGIGYPLQYSCLENPHGQRSLAGYSPWGCKELDMTERLSTHTYSDIY